MSDPRIGGSFIPHKFRGEEDDAQALLGLAPNQTSFTKTRQRRDPNFQRVLGETENFAENFLDPDTIEQFLGPLDLIADKRAEVGRRRLATGSKLRGADKSSFTGAQFADFERDLDLNKRLSGNDLIRQLFGPAAGLQRSALSSASQLLTGRDSGTFDLDAGDDAFAQLGFGGAAPGRASGATGFDPISNSNAGLRQTNQRLGTTILQGNPTPTTQVRQPFFDPTKFRAKPLDFNPEQQFTPEQGGPSFGDFV